MTRGLSEDHTRSHLPLSLRDEREDERREGVRKAKLPGRSCLMQENGGEARQDLC